jgi:N-acetyl-gamma-glutamyl-phosphate reductase
MRIKAGIAGAAGYTGGELIRILLRHPYVDIVFVHSQSQSGKKVAEVHRDLFGYTDLEFSLGLPEAEVIFLCLGHGDSRKFLEENKAKIAASTRIIDLSQDFRLSPASFSGEKFTYGLPECNKEEIAGSKYIANPGCFATAVQLALLPLSAAGFLENKTIHISATTGSTGAGQQLSGTSHFSWRQNNLSVYKPFAHQHLEEISRQLKKTGPEYDEIVFIPQRGAFTRGILAAVTVAYTGSQEEAEKLYGEYYREAPFTHLIPFEADLKAVVNTNSCHIQLLASNGHLLIVSVIDNLLKGACGQAVQNMNIMFHLPESAGLHLKASAF